MSNNTNDLNDGHDPRDTADADHSDGGSNQPDWRDTSSPVERRTAAIIDNVDIPIVEYEFDDGTATICRANDAFVRTFGPEQAALRNASLERVLDTPAGDLPVEGERRDDRLNDEVQRLTTDGWRTFVVSVVPLEPPDERDRPRQLATYSDLPIREEYDRKLEALHESTRELIQQDTAEGIAQTAVEAAVQILGLDATSVHLYDEERDVLPPTATTDEVRDIIGHMPELPLDDSLAGQVYRTGTPVVYDNPREHPGVYNPDTPIESELILPLGDYGVLLSGSTEPDAFSEADVSLATILASNTEAALERIEREAALAQRERELADRNERLEAFASMVSHDLRNPLKVAYGNLELARQDEEYERLEAVAQALERMETLIDSLLELARHGDAIGDVGPVDIETVARDAWENVDTRSATLEVTDGIDSVEADRSRLVECFENLFRNAIEHGGTDVTVRVGPSNGGFFVADDGPGIPRDERDRVFDIGHSSDVHGTGIGLAVVSEVAKGHDWTVSAGESADGGARFEFSFAQRDSD